MIQIFLSGALLVLFLFFPAQVMAGVLKTVPTRLFLDAKKKTDNLKVTNKDSEKVTLQLKAVKWSQDKDGVDRYEPTKDIIFFPKIFSMEKDEERIIRVGYQGKRLGTEEMTYRLFLQELPVTKPGETGFRMILNVAIPIFISPDRETQKMSIEKLELSKGNLLVRVKNSGNRHFVVSKINARGLDKSDTEVFLKEQSGWYVLSGVSKVFAIKIPHEECLKSRVIKVMVEVGRRKKSSLDAKLDVDKAMCAQASEDTKAQEKKRRIEGH